MKKFLVCTLTFCCGIMLTGGTIGYIYPSGARAGDTVQVIIGGSRLWSYRDILVSGKGVKLLKYQNAPGYFYAGCGDQSRWMREWFQRIYRGEHTPPVRSDRQLEVWRTSTYFEQLDQLEPLMLSLAARGFYTKPNSLQASPAIAQKLVLTLQISPDAKPGVREFRLASRGTSQARLSNPLRFYIGKAPEFQEQYYQPPPYKKNQVTFTIPGVINGQIEPGEVDIFRFHLNRDEKVNFQLLGRILNPFIGDGVPGNFQPVLEIRNAGGKVLAFADDNYFDPDPVLNFKAPESGTYYLVIRDALYRGREDFVYRIYAGKGDWKRPALPVPQLGLPIVDEIKAAAIRGMDYPALIRGKISVPGEKDSFTFQANSGEEVVLEVFARRQGSPLDSSLQLFDENGKLLMSNDDFERPNIGLNMQHVDSYIRFKAPCSGYFKFTLTDTAGAGGKDHEYFCRVDRPRPGFRAYLVPSAPRVNNGSGAAPIKVVVEKLDGFDDEISFEFSNTPQIRIAGINSIPAGADESMISFSAPWNRKVLPLYPKLYARSGDIRVPVLGADETTQAFAYTHYVPGRLIFSRCWVFGHSERFNLRRDFNYRMTIEPGAKVTFPIDFRPNKNHIEPEVTITLPDPPKGVSSSVKRVGDTFWMTIAADAKAPRCDINTAVKVKYVFKYKHRSGTLRRSDNNFYLPVFRLKVTP